MEIIALFLGVITSGIVAMGGYFKWQGDADIVLLPEGLKKISLKKSGGFFELNFEIPLINKGKQNGMLMDIFAQPAYSGKVLEKARIMPRFRLQVPSPRLDWYWESVIIKKQTSHFIEGSVLIQYQGEIRELLKDMPELTLVVQTKTVGRKSIGLKVTDLYFDLKEVLESGERPLKPR